MSTDENWHCAETHQQILGEMEFSKIAFLQMRSPCLNFGAALNLIGKKPENPATTTSIIK
jgi:hypothetical protein